MLGLRADAQTKQEFPIGMLGDADPPKWRRLIGWDLVRFQEFDGACVAWLSVAVNEVDFVIASVFKELLGLHDRNAVALSGPLQGLRLGVGLGVRGFWALVVNRIETILIHVLWALQVNCPVSAA
ncbi:hypothetical protein QAD02_011405 [Eretmocerus hayati]|uniref:Uncharacterized protein n=1 Tax=Eretmocerus hayati TaxID=131215 RepID=A0ACC2NZ97_9HYME|nr:hypothetical protein QAD02_011405 [Eretmocerus hayati]